LDAEVDLGRLETSGVNIEVEDQFRKFFELNSQFGLVPARTVSQLIVGQHVRLGFRLG
jgi:hypothetical protein